MSAVESLFDDKSISYDQLDETLQPTELLSEEDLGAEVEDESLDRLEGSTELLSPSRDINDVLNPPKNMMTVRKRLFEVLDTIELKIEEFETYWPYIDNVWVRQHRAGTDRSGRQKTDYYACRLQRPTYTPRNATDRGTSGEKPLRRKQIREGGTCQMRIKTVRVEGGYSGYIITRIGEQILHTHDLEHMDKIKRNSAIMDIARAEVMKGFMPASVFTIMSEDHEKLVEAGGRYLNRNDVHNASQTWRQVHRDQLIVHRGYKYDHGNGIVRDENAQSLTVNNNDESMIDPILAQHQALPSNTLRFPDIYHPIIEPYLPPADLAVDKGKFPFVTLTYASSMDSFLAISPGVQTLLSGPQSKAMTHYLRSKHDAILIGVGTALADDPGLNCRLEGVGGYGGLGWEGQPRPVIIDPKARWFLTPQTRVLQTVSEGKGRGPWIIVAPGFAMDPSRLELVKYYGGKYLGLPGKELGYELGWEAILKALAAEGIRSVMIEGGGTVINELLQPEHSRFVSSVVITVAPTYLGTGGVVVCPSRNLDAAGRPRPVVRFEDVNWQSMGEDVVMCGRIKNDSHL